MLKSFFWMCSGADTDLLNQSSKSEQIKYAGIGGTVFFTAILAFIAAFYALYTVFDNIAVAFLFGLVWGLVIFNLDRFIVSTIKKRDNFMDEIIQASPRILLAIIIAVVISKPLEIKIFEKEIDQVLLVQKNNMKLENQNQIGLLYNKEVSKIASEILKIEQNILQKEAEVNSLYETYIAEAEGRQGTNLIGKGPVYKEKREKHDAMLAELKEMKSTGASLIEKKNDELVDLKEKEQAHIADSVPIIDGFDGLMARVSALNELPWIPSFFIFLLFLAIETSPIFAKLLTPKGAYDIRLAEAEQKVSVWAEQKKRQREFLLSTETALNKKVYESLKNEDESYHYKKQKARALIHLQADAFLEEQKELIQG